MVREIVKTDRAPAAIGPYSQGIVCADLIFCAGQIPLDPKTGEMIEGEISDEVERVVENLKAVLETAGGGIEKVLRLDVFITDMSLFQGINDCLEKFFGNNPPARVTVEVSALPLGARVEIAAIGTK